MNRPTERPGTDRKKKPFIRRKVCRFCADKKLDIDYKNPRVLRYFVTERGKDHSPENLRATVRSTRER